MVRKKILLSVVILLLPFSINGAQGSYSVKQNPVSSKSAILIERTGDLLTMDIKDAALYEVLMEISRENGITFFLPPSLREEKVMVRFSNLKMDKGLRKILKGYNSIFIYIEENYDSLEPPRTSLREVRIYPRIDNKGRLKESFINISEGSTQAVQDTYKNTRKHSLRESVKRKGEGIVKGLYSKLRNKNPEVRLNVVEELAKVGGEKVIGPLAVLLKDKNPEVKKEAEKALEDIGKDLKEENRDDFSSDQEEEEPLPPEGEGTTLTLGSGSGNAVSLELNNDVPVRAVQCTLNGARPLEIRTTSRSEGFFAQYSEKNGTVILISIGGNTIAPGTGPIAEVICSNAGSASLSGVTIGK